MTINTGNDGVKISLAELRDQIDAVDNQLQALLNQRATLAQKVAEVKLAATQEKLKAEGESKPINVETMPDDINPVYYRPEREAQVLKAVMERNTGPINNEEMARLFREIMATCLALEQPLTVAYLGPEGTFTQAAVLKHFGHAVVGAPMAAIDDVFREVESSSVHYGVVPVENSTEGMVHHTLDSFADSKLLICGEVELRIHHHLMVKSGADENQTLTKIYSHQQSLAQCRRWLERHYPGVMRIAVNSNAEAARLAAAEPGAAAIAGSMAAELYSMTKLAENIEDQPDNTTRFLIIGRQKVLASGDDKTSLLVSTRNQPGALYGVLEPFSRQGLSLTRIETRPSRVGTWAYVFYIDFEGHVDDTDAQKVLAEIAAAAVEVKFLGSYPKAVL